MWVVRWARKRAGSWADLREPSSVELSVAQKADWTAAQKEPSWVELSVAQKDGQSAALLVDSKAGPKAVHSVAY